jgi:hypothetical protein
MDDMECTLSSWKRAGPKMSKAITELLKHRQLLYMIAWRDIRIKI